MSILTRLRLSLLLLFFVATPVFGAHLTITVEHADHRESRAWGLMQRHELPINHGMVFSYEKAERLHFWMFNTFIDLSVAFLDETHTIREIHQLKAHPEMMKALPPIRNLEALYRLPYGPVMEFFQERAIHSKGKYPYAVEMTAGWFKKHGITIGDKIIWQPKAPKARVEKKDFSP